MTQFGCTESPEKSLPNPRVASGGANALPETAIRHVQSTGCSINGVEVENVDQPVQEWTKHDPHRQHENEAAE